MKNNSWIDRAIRVYQQTFSPDQAVAQFGAMRCRFYPSCSEYTRLAVRKFGMWSGGGRALKRILKCNPFFLGGIDEL